MTVMGRDLFKMVVSTQEKEATSFQKACVFCFLFFFTKDKKRGLSLNY